MTQDSSKVPPEFYFEEQGALQLLAALADALGTAPAGDTVTIPRAPTAALLRPFISCPEAELPEAWEAMLRIAATMAGRAVPPAAPGEIVKPIREYLGVHPDLVLGGQVLDSMALELSRIAMDYPADLIGALALEELMQLGYTVEAGAILPPRDLPENACEFFGVRPVGQAPAAAVGPTSGEIDWDVLPEDPSERAMFDRNLKLLYGGDPRVVIATALRIWAQTHGNGSFGAQCAVYANEVAKMHIAVPAMEAPAALAAKPGGMIAVPFDLVVAACSAIDKKRDAPKLLAELRRYTTGDLARALEAPAVDALSQAERDVLAERRRQVAAEGHAAERDDGHNASELAYAAAWYATPPCARHALDVNDMGLWPITWPSHSFKPGDRRRELVKSSALAIAEAERMDRAAAQAKVGGEAA